MIDYIFYSRHLMRAVGMFGPLDAEWIKSNRIVGFPHPHVPSDHLPLMVELELFSPNQNNSNNNNSTILTSISNNLNLRPNQHHSHHTNNGNSNGNNYRKKFSFSISSRSFPCSNMGRS